MAALVDNVLDDPKHPYAPYRAAHRTPRFGTLTAAGNLVAGEAGTGTLNVSGGATVTANGDALFVGGAAGGNGTLNLNGGTVVAKRVAENGAAVSAVNFNGGLLKAGTGANATLGMALIATR